MNPILVDGPAVEPVAVSEMRAWLRLDHEAEDALLASLIAAARLAVEHAARRVLVETRWRLVLDAWPAERVVALPLSPLIALDAVRVRDAAGALQDLPPGSYRTDPAADPPRVLIEPGAPAPSVAQGGIELVFRAGFGASAAAVPEPLRQAVRLLVARWFEHRGDGVDAPHGALPDDVLALVSPYRRPRL